MIKMFSFIKWIHYLIVILLFSGFVSFSQSREEVNALLIKSKETFNKGGINSSLKQAKNILVRSELLNDKQLVWETKNLIGEIYLTKKDYRKSIHIFLEMTLEAERVYNYSISANGHLSLANIYATLGALIKANESYSLAFDQFRKIDYEMGMLEVKSASSFNKLKMNELDSALVEFNLLLALAERDSIPYFKLIAHDGLLEVYQKQGRIDYGVQTGLAYLKLIEEEGGSDQMALKAHNQLAILYFNAGRNKESLDELKHAQALGETANGSPKSKARTVDLFALVYAQIGDQDLAEKYRKMADSNTSRNVSEAKLTSDDIETAEVIAREFERNSKSIIQEKEAEFLAKENTKRDEVQSDELNRLSKLEHETLVGDRFFGHSALEAEFIHQDLMVAQHEFESTERQAEILRYKKELAIHKLELKVIEEEKLILIQRSEIQNKQKLLYLIVSAAILFISIILGVEYVRMRKINKLLANQQDTIHQRSVALEMSNTTIMTKNAKLHKAHDDIHHKNQELKIAQASLVQAEKMSALGLLTAGIAHEINNPINFVSNGLQVLEENIHETFTQIAQYDKILKLDSFDEIRQEYEKIGLEATSLSELKSDIEELIKDTKYGSTRIIEIVDGLRIFSRKDEVGFKKANLSEIMDSALLITKSKFKGRVKIIKQYDEHIPLIDCFPGQLNQIFINLVGNASDAIPTEGWIKIILQNIKNKYVRIILQDNGSGMSEEVKNQIFEPLFTTKESGKGTGLGLSITNDIIKTHEGTIEVRSKEGVGTAFIITLKVNARKSDPLKG